MVEYMLREAGIGMDEISEFYVAGAFGKHVSKEAAVTIGMYPDIDRRKLINAGNSSLEGAGKLLLCKKILDELDDILEKMVYIQFGAVEDFLELMVAPRQFLIPIWSAIERSKKAKRESRKRLKKKTLRKNPNRKQQAGESACKKGKGDTYVRQQFMDHGPVGREENTVQGKTYRFTLLTPCLIRMEYREDGQFEDRPTQSVLEPSV